MSLPTPRAEVSPAARHLDWLRMTLRSTLQSRRCWPGGTFLAVPLGLVLLFSGEMSLHAQQPPPDGQPELALPYTLRVQEPTRERVFRVESEEELLARLRKENPNIADRIHFPKTALSGEPLAVRAWAPRAALVEPNFVCYRPLYFEDKNTERYGWDFSIFQPIVSTGKFYLDLATLPYQMGAHPPWRCECNTEYFLPGDPAPYLLYVPPPSVLGTALQVGTVVGGIAIFP